MRCLGPQRVTSKNIIFAAKVAAWDCRCWFLLVLGLQIFCSFGCRLFAPRVASCVAHLVADFLHLSLQTCCSLFGALKWRVGIGFHWQLI